MAANDARVDTTFIGLLLIAFVLLMFGVLGLELGGLFGDSNYYDMPIDVAVFAKIVGLVGLILLLLTIFAYRTGAAVAAGVFAFVGAFFLFFFFDQRLGENALELLVHNSNWFLYIAIAIFFLIFAIYTFIAKAPKFLTLLLVLVAFVVFFFGLASFYGLVGPGHNADISKAMAIVTGIFAFLGFIIATYLGLAFASPKKIPLI